MCCIYKKQKRLSDHFFFIFNQIALFLDINTIITNFLFHLNFQYVKVKQLKRKSRNVCYRMNFYVLLKKLLKKIPTCIQIEQDTALISTTTHD